ncbi:MAG: hypothetical protein K940chlam8_00414 [Chlamydiae bacterium]|nr:hypothetical protein [Chlamydiota bacterium]
MPTLEAIKAPIEQLPPVVATDAKVKEEIFDGKKVYSITQLYWIVLDFVKGNQKEYQARVRLVSKEKTQVTDDISDLADQSKAASDHQSSTLNKLNIIGTVCLFGGAVVPQIMDGAINHSPAVLAGVLTRFQLNDAQKGTLVGVVQGLINNQDIKIPFTAQDTLQVQLLNIRMQVVQELNSRLGQMQQELAQAIGEQNQLRGGMKLF